MNTPANGSTARFAARARALSQRLGLRRRVRRGKPHGQGKITFTDGGTYEGEWEDGKITGPVWRSMPTACATRAVPQRHASRRGRMESPGGYVYEGDWVEGVKEGKGTITYPDGAVYEGGWSKPGSAWRRARSKCPTG
jgi:hypothetical protein